MVTADEILASLRAEFELGDSGEPRGSAPAELFTVDGGVGTVGVIASVTRPFCGDCDRVRLTADGQVRNCLFAREESDLRTALRAGASDEELADRWRAAVAAQARRSRDRRPHVPPADPADVRHRRLSLRRPQAASGSLRELRRCSPRACRTAPAGPAGRRSPGPPGSGGAPALASTTATYGRNTAPARKTQVYQWPTNTTARMKQTVRMPIEIR